MRSRTTWPSTPDSVPSAAMCANGDVVSTPLKSKSTASIVTRLIVVASAAAQTAGQWIRRTGLVIRVSATRWVVADRDRVAARVVDMRSVGGPLADLVALTVVGLHHHSRAGFAALVGADRRHVVV